jgi:hypothetical protein
MARSYKPTVALNQLVASPLSNPLLEGNSIRTRNRAVVQTQYDGGSLLDPETGELRAMSRIHRIVERDDAEFVKVFAEGVRAAFDLSRTGYRVFGAVLSIYQATSMKGGYAEAVELFWFGDGLCGNDVGMGSQTFNKGLRELIEKNFLALRNGNTYWVNPALFFKGNRVAFINEYRRKASDGGSAIEGQQAPPIEHK